MNSTERGDLIGSLGDNGAHGSSSQRVTEFITSLSDDTLNHVAMESKDWSPLHKMAFAVAVENYLDGDLKINPPVSYPTRGYLPHDAYFALAASTLITVLVEHNLPSLGAPAVLDWNGTYAENNESELCDWVSAELEGMFDSMKPTEASVRRCRGYYINGLYGGKRLSDDDFLWIHDHALEVMDDVEGFFRGGEFSRSHAEEMVSIKAKPMRQGVL